MNEHKTTTLPHVLKEYKPEYEPKNSTPSSAHGHQCEVKRNMKNKQDGHISRVNTRSPAQPKKLVTAKSGHRGRRYDNQRYEELSEKWDHAKQEVRHHQHEQLQEKIQLQQELIKKQDEYAEQRRVKVIEEQKQQKEAEKAKKLAQEKAFQQICRQSLEEDRKSAHEERRAKSTDQSSNAQRTGSTNGDSVTTSPGSLKKSSVGSPVSKRGHPLKSPLPTSARLPSESYAVQEEKTMKEKVNLPWHEAQLYKLYGTSADYFLHPKIEQKPVNPKLKNMAEEDEMPERKREMMELLGRDGANALWVNLRQESNKRLLKEDASIPRQLKDTYGAFARESLQQNRQPVRRMYYAEDDLPEMDRLTDTRKSQQANNMCFKTQIMYRASKTNEDRTSLLVHNNPLPEFVEGQANRSIKEYIPSWMNLESDDSEPDYHKWKSYEQSDRIDEADEEKIDTNKENLTPEHDVLNSQIILKRKKPIQKKPKYIFLSEEDACCKGKFSEKFKDERDNKDIPHPFHGEHRSVKSFTSLGMSESIFARDQTSTERYSAPLPSKEQLMNNYVSGWEPLSMKALMEYKQKLDTVGVGEFNMGRTKMWSTLSAV
ncbi:hypothetical protein CHS0354_030606 [Potamilus streckersoni]|uniref:Uncharacterized protein n=1 Tax=Potamilus streckersoni TaxID=2493646 RepID=A0AAE0VTE6_9BIVA|nr:hypothetical protein CHS0354_030606 [Potamilus streckersoni]